MTRTRRRAIAESGARTTGCSETMTSPPLPRSGRSALPAPAPGGHDQPRIGRMHPQGPSPPTRRVVRERPKREGAFSDQELQGVRHAGSVVDLAVGIVIGAAFVAVIQSFVRNLLTPLI